MIDPGGQPLRRRSQEPGAAGTRAPGPAGRPRLLLPGGAHVQTRLLTGRSALGSTPSRGVRSARSATSGPTTGARVLTEHAERHPASWSLPAKLVA